MSDCACAEVVLVQYSKAIGGRGQDQALVYRLPEPAAALHDCTYVAQRSALVPEAEAWANQVVGDNPLTDEAVAEWNVEFDREMRRLVRQRGLLDPSRHPGPGRETMGPA